MVRNRPEIHHLPIGPPAWQRGEFAVPVTYPEEAMKTVLYLLGVLLIVVAAIYLLVPADSLPSFFPGHDAGLPRPRMKHGLAAGAVGIVLVALGWFLGRRS